MENSTVIIGDEIREETTVDLFQRSLRKKRRRFTRRNVRVYSDQARAQQFNMILSCHAVFKRLIPSLLGVVALKFQAMSEDPFRPIEPWSFLVAIFMYSLILLAMKQSPNECNKYLQILCRIALAFEVVSSLSLISLLLQHFLGLLLIYNSWAIFAIISSLPVLHYTSTLLLIGIKVVRDYFIHFAWLRGLNSGQEAVPQATRLPV